MKIILTLLILITSFCVYAQDDYKTTIENHRAEKDDELQSKKTSPLQKADRKIFQDLPYFEIDEKWNLPVKFRVNETQETIASLEDHGDEVAPLPISNGNWVFSTAGTDWAPKSSSSKGLWQPMATVFPGIPVAIQLELTEKEAIRYAANLKGNGGIAVNYSYTFEGAKTPRTMTAEINYNSVANFFNEIDDDLSKSCSVDKPSSRDSITECDIDRHVIHTLTESLVQEGVVKMTCFDCEDEQKDTVNELTQLIVAKMFQPAEWESDPASIRTNPKPADCVIENHGCYRLDCDSSNNVYMKQDWSSVEDATLKIELVDQERQQFPGLVGHAELRLCDKVTDQITYFDEDFNIKPLCN